MESFDFEAHLSTLYASYPEAPQQPLIGITANFRGEEACLREKYYDRVAQYPRTYRRTASQRRGGHQSAMAP